MPKIILETSDISKFEGDAILCYCDRDISYKKSNIILQSLKYPNQNGYRNIIKSMLSGDEKRVKIMMPAEPAKDWWIKATKEEYQFCLHDKGL